MPLLTALDFASSFGTTAEDIQQKCSELLASKDFEYEVIEGRQLTALISEIESRISSDRQVVGSPERKEIWERGWAENLTNFALSSYNLESLIPKFIRFGQPLRLNQKFIQPRSPMFELDYYTVLRQWLYKTYLAPYQHIYEFGCGTGYNLVLLSHLFPAKQLYGLDFAAPAIELIESIAEHHQLPISGRLFDMRSPDLGFSLEEQAAVLTLGSIEQLAGEFQTFIDYLMQQPASLFIHMEPVVELYSENNPVDSLAIRFQSKRQYTSKFLPYLQRLAEARAIELRKVKRLFFGSLMMEGYNLIIWSKSF